MPNPEQVDSSKGPLVPQASDRMATTGLLDRVIGEFKEKPHTPELVNRFWQTFLETSITGQGLDIPVPVISCDRTQEELEALRKHGGMWVPETKLTYPQLGKIFPKMGSRALQENSPITIKDEFEQDVRGVDVEAALDAPDNDIIQFDPKEAFEARGRKGMRLSTFILTAQASKALTDHYLDEKTVSRLFGSSYMGRMVFACFYEGGELYVHWFELPRGHGSYLGVRSEGAKNLSS